MITCRAVIFLCLFFLSPAVIGKTLIEVFTNDNYGVLNANIITSNYQVISLNLDDNVRLQKSLSSGLSAQLGMDKIEAIANARIKSLGQDAIKAAWEPVVRAGYYELTKFPAIVFNRGEAVVYGITDLTVAVSMYEKWKNHD